MKNHLVQLRLCCKTYTTSVNTESFVLVEDFKESIKATFARKLNSYDEILLCEYNGTTKINPMDPIEILGEKKRPLIAIVEPVVEVERPQSSRQLDYKQSKRTFLLARTLKVSH
jgi:hypothetical protein